MLWLVALVVTLGVGGWAALWSALGLVVTSLVTGLVAIVPGRRFDTWTGALGAGLGLLCLALFLFVMLVGIIMGLSDSHP